MQDSTIAFKKELLTLCFEKSEYNWISHSPRIIESKLPLPKFSDEKVRERRKDEKILIAELSYPTGNIQSYHTFLNGLVENIYHFELNNEPDSRFLLKSLCEIRGKLDLANKYAKENYDGFKYDFTFYEESSIKLLSGEPYEKLYHKFNKYTFWGRFMSIFWGDPLQNIDDHTHNFYFTGESGEQLPVTYVTEFFLKGILDLIQIRLLIINKLIGRIEERLTIKPPAPEANKQGNKQKAGRPESKEVAERNNKIYKEYSRLTETKTDAEARPILLTTFKRYFKGSHETNRRSLDRILQKMKGQ